MHDLPTELKGHYLCQNTLTSWLGLFIPDPGYMHVNINRGQSGVFDGLLKGVFSLGNLHLFTTCSVADLYLLSVFTLGK